MKTQISKLSYEPGKRYSGVYQQQGRMITDADWNELVELLKERLNDTLKDVINDGAPRDRGVAIEAVDGTFGIRSGHLYVDGIKAEVPGDGDIILFNEQDDFPGAPAPDADAVVYADVWEKTVVSLEDVAMRDPGLHGADTCSRTQTLAQIKTCAPGVDVESDTTANPTMGNARVELRLWEESDADSERADPCITEVAENPRIGNYLFRVEVHDINVTQLGDTFTATLTIKWSEENGAEHHGLVWYDNNGDEQHGYEVVPTEFGAEDWVYEFYTDKSERHLGHQLNSNFTPIRGTILDSLDRNADLPYLNPPLNSELAQYVRRWDGYCVINLTSTTSDPIWVPVTETLSGEDKDQLLQDAETPGHGNVSFTQDVAGNYLMTLYLEKLILTFHLDASDFLAGDYWLTVVREDAPNYSDADPVVDERVKTINDGATLGIRHHYMKLAEIEGGAIKVVAEGSFEDRRMSFPPLTDISADHIAYDPLNKQARWEDIKETTLGDPARPNTVQSAIDELIENLESSDINYSFPENCKTLPYGATTLCEYLKALLRDRLGIIEPGTTVKIKDVWDELLCGLDAKKLPYDPTLRNSRWEEIKAPVGTELSVLHRWSRRFGGNDVDTGNAIVADLEDNLIVIGEFSDTLNFGGDDLLAQGGMDIFMVKLDALGEHVWSQGIGGTGYDHAMGLGVDAENNIVICGSFEGSINFGGADLINAGGYDIFVAKFNADGEHLWSQAYGDIGSDQSINLAIDSGGEIIVTGMFEGTVNFGGDDLLSEGAEDIFLLKLGPDGSHVWSSGMGGVGFGAGIDVAIDSSGQIVLGGIFSDTVNLGGSDLISTGAWDIFIAKFATDGTHIWSNSYGGSSLDVGFFLAIDSNDNLLLTGGFEDSINFGGADLVCDSGRDVFLVKLDATGNHIWSKDFSGGGFNVGYAINVDPSDNIVLGGQFSGSINFGGTKLQSAGATDVFFAKFNSAGDHVWSGVIGQTGSDNSRGVAIDSQGDFVFTGYFEGTINFGGDDLNSAGASDIFVAKLAGQTILPLTVQDAVDDLLENLESSDIGYTVPTCPESPSGLPRLKDLLALTGTTDLKSLWDQLLCELDASTLPVGEQRNNLFADTDTVQQALDTLSTRGSGLADLIARLAEDIAISGTATQDDELNVKPERQQRIFERPVQGEDAFLRVIAGMGLDLVRIASTLVLEFLDAGKAILLNGAELGHSGGLSLSTLSTTEGYVALWRRIREQLQFAESFVDNELLRVIAHSAAYVLGTRLINDPSSTEDPVQVFLDRITEMEPEFGTDISWNGHVIRITLLKGLYQPIIGSDWLDHNATLIIKQVLLDFLERLWHELSQRLLLENVPELPHPAGEEWMTKIGTLLEAINRATGGDGLASSFDTRFDFERIDDVLIPPSGVELAVTWLRGTKRLASDGRSVSVLSRIQHNEVLRAFENEAQEVPAPDLNLMPSTADGWLEFLNARVSDAILHIDIRTTSGDLQCTILRKELVDLKGDLLIRRAINRGVDFIDPATGGVIKSIPFPDAVIAPIDYAMYRLVDGTSAGLIYFTHTEQSATAPVVTLTCSNWMALYSTRGEFEIGAGRTLTGLQGVYSLSQEKPAQGTHLLAVMDVNDGQILVLLQGMNETGAPVAPWWTSASLQPITVLFLGGTQYRIIGALHDQLIVEFQTIGDSGQTEPYWMFVPFRALDESLFGDDGVELGTIVHKGTGPIPQVYYFEQDNERGRVYDIHAGTDPLLSVMVDYSHRRFYRCYTGIFPELDIELPVGASGHSQRQCAHQLIPSSTGTRLLSLTSGWTDVEYQLLNLTDITP
jgi:hypothetical protein